MPELSRRSTPARLPNWANCKCCAKVLLHMLLTKVNGNPTVILPTIAISELLVPVPDAQRGQLAATLATRFVAAPFDIRAASIAAELWSKHKKLPSKDQYKKRDVLKADAMIVASAYAAGATEFYTCDKKCRKLAVLLGMKSPDLPTHDPNDMFLMNEVKHGNLKL